MIRTIYFLFNKKYKDYHHKNKQLNIFNSKKCIIKRDLITLVVFFYMTLFFDVF